ncbi:MAG: putative transcriptional regulator, ArsR family protein [Actinomycetota bacterium]|nr:MAG: putative transcriptional regulator, ArsR family protein [Actinomycetota bacterium]
MSSPTPIAAPPGPDGPPAQCCAPLATDGLSEREAAATAELFKALADPARVRIVNRLATSGRPVCVCDLVEPLGLTQPTVSFHMKKLVDAGLLRRERRGRWAYYSLDPAVVGRLADVLRLEADVLRLEEGGSDGSGAS